MRRGAVVQSVLLGAFALGGLLATVAVVVDWLQGLDTWFWRESICTIESSAVVERPELGDFDLALSYRYTFRGESYRGDAFRHGFGGSEKVSDLERMANRYAPRSEVRCWVDPDEPQRAYLRRANLWRGFLILAPLLFVAVGAGGLWLLHAPARSARQAEASDRAPRAKRARAGVGVGVMVVFFGLFFLFGAGFLVPFFVWPALQVLEARSWVARPCEIVDSGVRAHPGDDSTTYRVDVLYRYEIDGREVLGNRYQFMGGSSSGYERKAEIVEALPAGSETVCWVDPDDPFEAVIERGFTGDYLFGLVPLLFAAIGLGGLVFAIQSLRGARKDAARPSWAAATGPGASAALGARSPAADEAPGSGPMVLEPAMGPWRKLGCQLLFTLFWNGFVSIFVWAIAREWTAGDPQWFAALVLSPFVLIGLLLLVGVPFSLLALLNPRPRVHLTPGALKAGEPAHLEWAFRGAGGRIERLEIWLEATETRTSVGESSVQVETREADTPRIEVLERGRELPLEYGAASFRVPIGTPPTSEGEAAIRWKLKLHGAIAWWPDVNEEYEVRVLPAEG